MPGFRTQQVTIANGGSLSGAATGATRVGGGATGIYETLVGIIMPASWSAASLTFQASNDNSTFTNLYNAAGTEVTATVSAARWVAIDPADFAGVAYLKVRSGTSGTPVNQGADRTITLVFRAVS